MDKAHILIVMGVSGCGKTTIAKLLSKELGIPYFDGDDFHTEENVSKMSKGLPLNDSDRQGWLNALNELAINNFEIGVVIACSALKQIYRDKLKNKIEDSVRFIYLEGTFEEIYQRMQDRKDHFMPAALLKSQFKALQPPKEAITVSINGTPEEILKDILNRLKQKI